MRCPRKPFFANVIYCLIPSDDVDDDDHIGDVGRTVGVNVGNGIILAVRYRIDYSHHIGDIDGIVAVDITKNCLLGVVVVVDAYEMHYGVYLHILVICLDNKRRLIVCALDTAEIAGIFGGCAVAVVPFPYHILVM